MKRSAFAAVTVLAVAAGTGTAVALLHQDSPRAARAPRPALTPTTSPAPITGKPPLPPRQVVRVGWLDKAYDGPAPPFPGTVADPSVPWCRASDLSVSSSWQGATGNWFGGAIITNSGPDTCAVQGQPSIAILDRADRELVRADADPFYVDAWVRLRPEDSAVSEIEWYQEFCNLPRPHTLQLTLPHDGGVLRTSMRGAPRCNADTDPPSAGHLELHGFVRWTTKTVDSKYTRETRLVAEVGHVGRHVLTGDAVHYRVRLFSTGPGQVQLRPCLPYREQLLDRFGDVVAQQSFYLDCNLAYAQPDTPQSGFVNFYAMRLQVPASLAPGRYSLRWQSVLEPVQDTAAVRVVVSSPPPPCTQQQLRITAGRSGVGLGSYYAPVVFHNISTEPCSLRGFPGVQFVAPDGHAVATHPVHETTIATRTVVLQPGRAASAMLSGSDFGPNGGATPCPDVSGVRVIAPGLTTQVFVPAGVDNCNEGDLFVSTVQPGARPQP